MARGPGAGNHNRGFDGEAGIAGRHPERHGTRPAGDGWRHLHSPSACRTACFSAYAAGSSTSTACARSAPWSCPDCSAGAPRPRRRGTGRRRLKISPVPPPPCRCPCQNRLRLNLDTELGLRPVVLGTCARGRSSGSEGPGRGLFRRPAKAGLHRDPHPENRLRRGGGGPSIFRLDYFGPQGFSIDPPVLQADHGEGL